AVKPARWIALALLATLAIFGVGRGEEKSAQSNSKIDFRRDIRPILSENCFACHGPDEKQRKAKFRLDTKAGAFADLRDGDKAIVPGKPGESMLIERITATNKSKTMPPTKSGKSLKPDQIALLKQWIEQGATWSEHWAFATPQRPALPEVK